MPTSIPVTAGKNTAKTIQKLIPSVNCGVRFGSTKSPQPPVKNEMSAATRIARMPYWIFSAKSAPTHAMTTNTSATTVAMTAGLYAAKNGSAETASVKPMM